VPQPYDEGAEEAARPVDHLPARVELIQLARPEGGVQRFALGAAHARHHVDLGDEGAVDDEVLVILVDLERGLLGLYVDRKVGSRKHAVQLPIAAAKVRLTAMCKVQMRVLLGN